MTAGRQQWSVKYPGPAQVYLYFRSRLIYPKRCLRVGACCFKTKLYISLENLATRVFANDNYEPRVAYYQKLPIQPPDGARPGLPKTASQPTPPPPGGGGYLHPMPPPSVDVGDEPFDLVGCAMSLPCAEMDRPFWRLSITGVPPPFFPTTPLTAAAVPRSPSMADPTSPGTARSGVRPLPPDNPARRLLWISSCCSGVIVWPRLPMLAELTNLW